MSWLKCTRRLWACHFPACWDLVFIYKVYLGRDKTGACRQVLKNVGFCLNSEQLDHYLHSCCCIFSCLHHLFSNHDIALWSWCLFLCFWSIWVTWIFVVSHVCLSAICLGWQKLKCWTSCANFSANSFIPAMCTGTIGFCHLYHYQSLDLGWGLQDQCKLVIHVWHPADWSGYLKAVDQFEEDLLYSCNRRK